MKRSVLWILLPLAFAAPARAQYDQAQLVQPEGVADLNANLSRLAANPRDVAALIGAGEAALVLDDPRAAAGFFARADAIESGNGRIKAGLARVNLKMQNPAEALRLFDQAGRLGYPDATILSDRGLAHDMMGEQAAAQRDYQAALLRSPDDAEIVRRYAASLGISGQVDAAERILKPLFYKSDRAAWRYRAFIYAMNNRQAEAKKIADQTMPAQLAGAIVPYMLKMPYLTGAQKAAAVHFGHFPARVGTMIAAITPTPAAPGGPVAPVATAAPARVATRDDRRSRRARAQDARLASAETGRGSRTVPGRSAAVPAAAPVTTPEPVPPAPIETPTRQAAPVPQRTAPVGPTFAAARPVVQSLPVRQDPVPAPVQGAAAIRNGDVAGPPQPGFDTLASAPPASSPAPAPVTGQPGVGSQLNAITLAKASTPVQGPPSSSVETVGPPSSAPASASPDLQPVAPPAAVAAPPPVPADTPAPNPEATRSLADIIRAIDVPESERNPTVAAVDLTEIEQIQAARRAERQSAAEKAKKVAAAKAKAEADTRAKAEAEAKAKLAANPSRAWLQIATGASRNALGFTLKAMRRKYVDIAMQKSWIASWARTNRLLIGPFAGFKRAKEMEQSLKAAGADVFAWQSDAGEVVDRFSGE